jgi:hypothetical protein
MVRLKYFLIITLIFQPVIVVLFFLCAEKSKIAIFKLEFSESFYWLVFPLLLGLVSLIICVINRETLDRSNDGGILFLVLSVANLLSPIWLFFFSYFMFISFYEIQFKGF